jgi:acyl dehydratase
MAIDEQLISHLEKKAGEPLPPIVYNIEPGMIKRFIRATGDANPAWQDEDCSWESLGNGCNGIVAPPGFALTLGFIQVVESLISGFSPAVLHGSTELESLQPVRAGDVITVYPKITAVRQRQGKSGLTVFLGLDLVCSNQRREAAARCSQMLILY